MKKSVQTEEPMFPIPGALHDLERAPYNLLPYPEDFEDDDEAARAESFDVLVLRLENGNRTLSNSTIALFESEDDDEEPWNDEVRMQDMYTLVRKSSSIANQTRKRLIDVLCEAVLSLQRILSDFAKLSKNDENNLQQVVTEEFRAAFSFHVYMLFSIMFLTESEAKGSSEIKEKGKGENKTEISEKNTIRLSCAEAMLSACVAMCKHKSHLWQRGVADEAVVMLPCRISYQMLESATGIKARKAVCGDSALKILASTIDSFGNMNSQIVVALIDLLHAYDHMAPLVAELCGMVNENLTNRFAIELLREIGRLNTNVESYAGGKASGIKNLAPFISDLAHIRPRLVLANVSQILPHLNSEPYSIRSAVVAAMGHILVYIGSTDSSEQNLLDENKTSNLDLSKSRNKLLDLLTERILDVSSFTRAAVLKAFISIVQAGSLPIDRLMSVTKLSADRLQDKTVMVRRYAMQLLTTLLEHNPFLGSLHPKPYQDKLAEVYQKIQENMPEDIKEAREANLKDATDDDTIKEIDQAALSAAISYAESQELTDQDVEFRSNVKALKFTQAALDFINQFEYASESCQSMLLSKNTSDVTEALRFFVKARHFQLPCAVTGMKHALALMWSSEQSIRDEVLQAFIEIFLSFPGTDGKENLPDEQIAHNLVILVGQASISELASIEEALGRLVKSERIPVDVFMVLWAIASKAGSETRSAALLVLSMAASANRSIIDSASRLRLLVESGLGDYVEEKNDWRVVRSAACALQRVSLANLDPTSAKAVILEHIIERLCVVIRGDWCVDEKQNDTLHWFSAAEQSIDALFVVSEEPEIECAEIIRVLTSTTFGLHKEEKRKTCHSLRLARFFFVLGHIALKLLVHTEYISGALLRANAQKSLKQQEIADDAKARKSVGEIEESEEKTDAIEAELGVAAEIEAENERRFTDIAEREILGRGIIKNFTPLLIRIVGNDGGNFQSEILRQSSTLALCKFMCISTSFCEEHLPLVFTTLSNAPAFDTILRANIVVALGDHAFRFPNEVEPYTPRIYACLRDESTKVRRHTLMVLTHLILNDMVKVKGQVCEIAICLRDNDARIRDMSRLLFYELSKRSNNPIYNLLPDIISQLSQLSMKKDDFRFIMAFLLGFIKKDRQNEMLVEKLCQRFPKCQSISQKADLTFCIAQLKINEKAVKTLIDQLPIYKDALFDEEVRKTFLSLVARAKKIAKPEMKESLADWESKINNHSALGQENEAISENAVRAQAKAAKRANKLSKKKSRNLQTRQKNSLQTVDEADKENVFG